MHSITSELSYRQYTSLRYQHLIIFVFYNLSFPALCSFPTNHTPSLDLMHFGSSHNHASLLSKLVKGEWK